ncbi:hypothetical protein [Chromobacterium haemolyticum]|nr:hypothetical protein [Chromobacterium haemolyticum]
MSLPTATTPAGVSSIAASLAALPSPGQAIAQLAEIFHPDA